MLFVFFFFSMKNCLLTVPLFFFWGGGILFARLFYNCRHKSLSMTLKSLETAAGEGSAAEQLKLLQRLLLRRLRVRLLQSQRERKSCPPHQDKRAPLMKQSKSKQKWKTLSRRFKPRRASFSPKKEGTETAHIDPCRTTHPQQHTHNNNHKNAYTHLKN